jgi:hypothetical protein
MARSLGLPRIAAGLAGISLATVLAAACGGSGSVDEPDAANPDGRAPDGQAPDAGGPDATRPDSGAPDGDAASLGGDGAAHDGSLDAEGGTSDSGTSGLMQSLFTAAPFVVLGGATVTNSGVATMLIGDVGTTGPSITGLTGPPFQPSGTMQVNNAVAMQAVLDLGTAYKSLTGQACPPANHLTGMDLGGMTLEPGVYCFTSSAGQIASTTLTFDAQGDPNAVWIIQIATALTVMNDATAVVINGLPSMACRIFWTTGTGATIDGNSHYLGNVLASSQTSLLTGASLSPGRAFGIGAGVTLLSNTVTAAACP